MSGYNAEREKARRDDWRKRGICTQCGKRPAFGDYRRCEYCIERDTMKSYRWRQQNRDQINAKAKLRRQREIAEGKCPSCHRPNTGQRITCPRCLAYMHRRYVRNYTPKIRPDGMCMRCERQAMPGMKLCEIHRALAAAAGEKGRAAQDMKRHPWRLDDMARYAGRKGTDNGQRAD